jgi:serine/threonine-protein kinase
LRDRYRLTQPLARGGFAVVYEGVDALLRRPVAIKLVRSASPPEQRQVEREVHILSQYATQLPFIPDIYDVWSAADQTYLVMEFIAGPTLDQTLARPWSPTQTTRFLRALLRQMAELHAHGIVHRDLKPANIKRTARGGYVLLDFGIAKQHSGTLAMAQAGSLDYAPLEQLQGVETDARSDLYSLAATAYHLLTGTAPPSVPHRLADGAALIAPSAVVAGVAPELDRALLEMLALEKADRPPDAKAAFRLLRTPRQTAE